MNANPITTAVILAAGRGTRLGDKTQAMPKGFIRVGGEAIVERSFRLLRQHGIERLMVGVGHQHGAYEQVQAQYGLTIYHNPAYATTESMYTLACAEPYIDGDFLLLESDLLYEARALKALLAAQPANVILGSGFTHAGDEVYLNASPQGRFRYLTQDANDQVNAYAELVGISKWSFDLYKKVLKLPVKQMKYEYGWNALAAECYIHVEKQEGLVWCEIDDEQHLHRAKTFIYPQLES